MNEWPQGSLYAVGTLIIPSLLRSDQLWCSSGLNRNEGALSLNINWPKRETDLHLDPRLGVRGAGLSLQDMALSHGDIFVLTLHDLVKGTRIVRYNSRKYI
jgi:hypothetical protein